MQGNRERAVASGLRDEDFATLKHTVLFGALADKTLQALLSDATVSHHERGEMLFMQGDAARWIFVVLDGWAKVYRMTAAGEEAVVGIFTRGQNFAEAAAFTAGIYPASGEAVTEVRLLKIPARRVFDMIAEKPEIGLAMLGSTSQHLHLLVRQIEQLKAHTGAQRVAEFLVSLSPVRSGPCTIELPYDKALLAGKLGMKPESLSRAFQRLRSCGVSIKRETAIVRDIGRLVDFMEQERAEVMRPGAGNAGN